MKNFIAGENVEPLSGQYLENFEPATGKVYGRIPDSDQEDVNLAVKAAKQAFKKWSSTRAEERSVILRRLAHLIRESLDDLAAAESRDTGKPLSLAKRLDIPRSSKNFEFFADAITQFSSECHVSDQDALNYTLRSPLGVVACISPWNLPLYLLTWKIAPALAAGNCVVAKPSEITPMTASLLGDLANKAGLPPGVLNIVHGTGPKVGAALCCHPDVAAVSFTGSTRTGKEIASVSGSQFKKISLEMGGKNPTLVFADCDFDLTVREVVRSAFLNQGQICLCGSRIFVEKSIFEKFKAALVDQTKKLKIGDPQVEGTDQGAVVSASHCEKVLSYIEKAKSEGGRILTGGRAAKLTGRCAQGWFIEPTLIEGLSQSSAVNQDEIFGPVATLIPFENETELLKQANDSTYGLASSIWTQNLEQALRVSKEIQTGIVWVNCWMFRDLRTPFGGMKNSGVGREGGLEALRFFTEPKNICVHMGERHG